MKQFWHFFVSVLTDFCRGAILPPMATESQNESTGGVTVHERLALEMRAAQAHCAWVGAKMLLVEPDPEVRWWGDLTIFKALSLIPLVGSDRARTWLHEAHVDPLRRIRDLKSWQKRALARQLVDFAKAERPCAAQPSLA